MSEGIFINTSELNLAIDGLNGSFNATGDMTYTSRLEPPLFYPIPDFHVHPAVPITPMVCLGRTSS